MTFNPKPPHYNDVAEQASYYVGYSDGWFGFEMIEKKRYPNAYYKGYWEGKADKEAEQ